MHNLGNGKCVDNALEDAAKIQIWSCVNGDPHDPLPEGMEQMWTIELGLDASGSVAFQIRNRFTRRCIMGSDELFNFVAAEDCSNDYTEWRVIYENDSTSGWYQVLQNTRSGQCLDLTNNSSVNGTPLREARCDRSFTSPGQQWRLGEDLPFNGGVTVPDVLGSGEQPAADALTSAGLTVDRSYADDCASPGDVEIQHPSGGAIMSPGTSVHLTISTCSGGGGDDGGGGVPK
jgi:hypothetical protein